MTDTAYTEGVVIGAASNRVIERFKNYFDGSGSDTGFISVNDIVIVPGFNSRNFNLPENRAHLDDLKAKIVAYGGIHTPIKVAFDNGTKTVELIGGECRYRAVKELNEEAGEEKYLILAASVPRSKVQSEADRIELSLSDNSGKPFSQWEIGTDYEKLRVLGRGVAYIATKYNLSERYVRDAIDLADASDDIKIALSKGEITVAVALKAIRNSGSNAGQVIAAQVATAKAAGTGKVIAKYTKRTDVVKVPVELLKEVAKLFQDYELGNQVLQAKIEALIPSNDTTGTAAKTLEEF
jgi:hypothetical protein